MHIKYKKIGLYKEELKKDIQNGKSKKYTKLFFCKYIAIKAFLINVKSIFYWVRRG